MRNSIARIQEVRNDPVELIRRWDQLLKISYPKDGTPAEDLDELSEQLGLLGETLCQQEHDYKKVMSYYNLWLNHPNNRNTKLWCVQLAATAARFYETAMAGGYSDALHLYHNLFSFYKRQALPLDDIYRNTVRRLSELSLLNGWMAEAMLYSIEWKTAIKQTSDLQAQSPTEASQCANWMRTVEDTAFIFVVSKHALCERLFGLMGCTTDLNKKHTIIEKLADTLGNTATRLWVAASGESNRLLKFAYLERIVYAYDWALTLAREHELPPREIARNYYHAIEDYQQGRSDQLPVLDEALRQLHAQPQSSPWQQLRQALKHSRHQLRIAAKNKEASTQQPLPEKTTKILVDHFEWLFHEGEKLLGGAPCAYAMMAVGSLARGEACPFSDLEFVIVLDNKLTDTLKPQTLAYFKALLQWMEIQLIALGETRKAVVWPMNPHSNLTTKGIVVTQGFRFDDGGNVPFSGKDRNSFFIGRVDELLANAFRDANDNIAINAFQGVARVWGDEQCANELRQKLWENHLKPTNESTHPLHQDLAMRLLQSHLNDQAYNREIGSSENHDTQTDESHKTDNIKENFLRLPVFMVETLALYCGINETNNQKRLDALVAGRYISPAMADGLSLCIRFGLEVRTKAHLHYGLENDAVYVNREAAQVESETNPYLLSKKEKLWLQLFYTLVLSPTKKILQETFAAPFPDLLTDSKVRDESAYQAAFKENPDTIDALREEALLLRSYGDWDHAMRYSRFSLTIADEDIEAIDPTHDAYEAYLKQLNTLPATETQQRLNLPEPNGMRPLMLRKKREWLKQFMTITEAPENPTDEKPPHGRLLLEGLDFGKRLLKSTIAKTVSQQLVEPEAMHGTRNVIITEHFCFKIFPEYPGTEIAACDLVERLVGGHVHEPELARLLDSEGRERPVLILRRVPGRNIAERCCDRIEDSQGKIRLAENTKKKQSIITLLSTIDSEQFSRLFIAALLLTNEDGKSDNIMLTFPEDDPNLTAATLTLIDNDRSFLPVIATEVRLDKKIRNLTLQMKQFIFCMDQMRYPLHENVQQEIFALDAHALLDHWLSGLAVYNQQCARLFGGHEKVVEYYNPQNDNKRPPTILPTVLMKEAEARLFSKLRHLRNLVEKDRGASQLKVLSCLEPDASASYQRAFRDPENRHCFQRWQSIANNYYEVGRNVGLASLTNYQMITRSLKIYGKNDLRQLLIHESTRCCIPSRSQKRLLQEKYIAAIREELYAGKSDRFQLLTNAMKKSVLESIPFKKLKSEAQKQQQRNLFAALSQVSLVELTLRHASELTDAALEKILKNSGEYLISIELSDCPQLTDTSAQNIAFYCKKLESLKIDSLPKLQYLRQTTFFGSPSIEFSNVKRLSVSHCPQLQETQLTLAENAFSFYRCQSLQNLRVNENAHANAEATEAFFKKIAQGNRKDIWMALHENPSLVYNRHDINPEGETAWRNITALQYGLATQNWSLCYVVLEYLPKKAARQQVFELKRHWRTFTDAPASPSVELAYRLEIGIYCLLSDVTLGNIEAVEETIKDQPELLTQSRPMVDPAGRFFHHITVFQYAAWNSDMPMCEMILRYLPKEEAAKQLNTLETAPETLSEHGKQFNFDPLIQQYDNYLANYSNWDYDTCVHHWTKGVGGEQYKMPTWYIYKFMEEGKPVAWTEKDTARAYNRVSTRHEWYDWILDDNGILRGEGVGVRLRLYVWMDIDLEHDSEMTNCEKLAAETYRRGLLERLDIEQSQNVEAMDESTPRLRS